MPDHAHRSRIPHRQTGAAGLLRASNVGVEQAPDHQQQRRQPVSHRGPPVSEKHTHFAASGRSKTEMALALLAGRREGGPSADVNKPQQTTHLEAVIAVANALIQSDPLEDRMMRNCLVAMSIASLAVAGSSACASKKFVRTSVGDVNEKVDALGHSLEETQERTRKNEKRIGEVDQKAQAADQLARTAHGAASKAAAAADMAAVKIDTIDKA